MAMSISASTFLLCSPFCTDYYINHSKITLIYFHHAIQLHEIALKYLGQILSPPYPTVCIHPTDGKKPSPLPSSSPTENRNRKKLSNKDILFIIS
jgi:hypothetical protein